MKKLISLAVLCFPLIAFAQLEKGKSFLSGSFGYSGSGSKNDTLASKYTRFSFAGSYGFLISDRWATGITLNYGYYKTDNLSYTSRSNELNVGPFVRRYFGLGEKFFLFIDGGATAGFVRGKTTYTAGNNPPEQKEKGLHLYVRPGITYFINNKVALQTGLGGIDYEMSKNIATGYKYWSSGVGFDFDSFYFGASWYF